MQSLRAIVKPQAQLFRASISMFPLHNTACPGEAGLSLVSHKRSQVMTPKITQRW